MTKERVASLIFLFAGIYGLVFSLRLPFGRLQEPGPSMLPLCLSIFLTASGILWFICGGKREGAKEGAGKIDRHGLPKGLMTPLKIMAVTAAFILAVGKLGYLLTSFFYLFVLFFWVSRYRISMAIGLSFLIGAGSWYFFERFLWVQLPPGIFPR
jgi:hypothetical protein